MEHAGGAVFFLFSPPHCLCDGFESQGRHPRFFNMWVIMRYVPSATNP
jgi:hypothetical protein